MIGLKGREKRLATALAGVVALIFIYVAVISPTLRTREQLKSEIRQARAQLVELRSLKREYEQITREITTINQKVSRRPSGFTLFSFLDQTANRLNLKNNLTSMKPSRRNIEGGLVEDIVEVRLEGISLENLVAYLYEIERTGVAVAISTLRIQPESRLSGGLNVSMVITSVGRQ
ncbi:MAG: hypothetical protein Kow0099_05890 [Candidatus Abyssubacteria bacterium]